VALRDVQVVDVRTSREVERTPIPDCARIQHIPLDELRERIGELDPNLPTVLVCATGMRSYVAARILAQRGFSRVTSLMGGVMLRECAAHACESSEPEPREAILSS
jgi:rhodanese-related sulfurtransferase